MENNEKEPKKTSNVEVVIWLITMIVIITVAVILPIMLIHFIILKVSTLVGFISWIISIALYSGLILLSSNVLSALKNNKEKL